MWLSAEACLNLKNAIRKEFPDRPLPFNSEQMREVGEIIGVQSVFQHFWLRMELREIAYDVWRVATYQDGVTKAEMRALIDNEIIKPANQLRNGMALATKLGLDEGYARTWADEYAVGGDNLRQDLRKLVQWSEQVKLETFEKSFPKGTTNVRQIFVDRLAYLYVAWTGDVPTRTSSKVETYQPEKKVTFHEDGNFTIFVDACAKPIFNERYNFQRQIVIAQQTQKAIRSAVQKGPEQRPGFAHRILSKIQPA